MRLCRVQGAVERIWEMPHCLPHKYMPPKDIWTHVGEVLSPHPRVRESCRALPQSYTRNGTMPPPSPPSRWSHCHLISTETTWLLWALDGGWGDGSENSRSFQDPGWQGLWEAGLAQITPNSPSFLPSLATTTKDWAGGGIGTAWVKPTASAV